MTGKFLLNRQASEPTKGGFLTAPNTGEWMRCFPPPSTIAGDNHCSFLSSIVRPPTTVSPTMRTTMPISWSMYHLSGKNHEQLPGLQRDSTVARNGEASGYLRERLQPSRQKILRSRARGFCSGSNSAGRNKFPGTNHCQILERIQ